MLLLLSSYLSCGILLIDETTYYYRAQIPAVITPQNPAISMR